MIKITDVRLIDPASGTDGQKDVWIDGERIVKILDAGTEWADAPEAESVLAGAGLTAFPGLVDTHVHFRDPGLTYKEDIFTGAKAAAAGGFTSVVLMANTKPSVDSCETLQYVLERGAQTDIHVYSCANVTMGMKGQEMTDMPALKAAGAVGFTDDGVPILSEELARKSMEAAKALELPISFHEENPAFIQNNGVNHGTASAYYGIGGSDRQAEIDLIDRDLKLAEETKACVVVQHISTAEGVELVRQAKAKGLDVHAEATPHHFTLTEEAVIAKGTLAKMNPPLRTEADRQAIIAGLQDGTIDLIATDHAPHAAEEKAKPITEAPSGITGLETSLALAVKSLVQPGHLTLLQLAERMSLAPARLYGLDAGTLTEGGPADLVLFAPEEEWIFETSKSRSANSPFLGEQLPGRIHYTICGGKIV